MLHTDDNQLKSVLYITMIFEAKPKLVYYINHVSLWEAEESLRTRPRTSSGQWWGSRQDVCAVKPAQSSLQPSIPAAS